jgi:hypothetical protein
MSMSSRFLAVLFGLALILAACDDNNSTTFVDGGNVNADGGNINADGGTTRDTAVGGIADAAGEVGTTSVGGGDGGSDAGGGAAPTFTQVYTTVIGQRCMPCHTTSAGIGVTMGHLDMTTQAAAFMNLVNAPAAGIACSGKGTRVVPGMQDQSIMYLKVSLDDPTPCGAKMPLGLPALSQAETDLIENWIKAGAKND